jgi:amino acid adenylation domain-containing protein
MLLTGTAKLDVTLFADPWDGGSTRLLVEYSTDLFGPAWADRFVACLAHLLEFASQKPGTSVTDLPMLSAAETEALILGRNRPAPRAGDGHGLDVRAVLQASTSRVIDGDVTVPVSQLVGRAARLARTLADRGAGPETLVGVCLDRGADMLAALLSVWWAGGAFVPLDPGLPPARLAAMARAAQLRTIVSDARNTDLARSLADGVDVVSVDDSLSTAGTAPDPVPVPASALAYVIHVPGPTGQPKGVGVEHRALGNLLLSYQRPHTLDADDRFVAVTTLSSDIALVEFLLPLLGGADLVIASTEDGREPDRLRSLIERTGAVAMHAPPQAWRLLDAAGGVPAVLRLRLSGGGLPADLAERLMAPGVTLWTLYGSAETTVWSGAGIVTSATRSGDIGPAIDYSRVYVLDEHLMPVPVGVVGEICLAGPGVARGYHDRPRLTARAFRPDPWSGQPGGRLYRTGDLGRWREGGGLELVGRNDHQVTIRGVRIEPGEIEAALRAHRDVRQAVVVTADRAGEPALVAYLVARRGSTLAQPDAELLDQLRPHLRATLPEPMIPALVLALPALPLTANAKVDRAALPDPQWGSTAPRAGYVEPRDPVEATLTGVWRELLATEAPISVHDNLFALGGHELTATRFVARVADTYGVLLSVHQVFVSPTIAELAEVISADPDFGKVATSPHQAMLDGLSDDGLDELLRAALAERARRQAGQGSAAS